MALGNDSSSVVWLATDRSQDLSVQMDELRTAVGTANRRFQITAESRVQRIDRKVSGVEVPIQLTVARFGIEFGFLVRTSCLIPELNSQHYGSRQPRHCSSRPPFSNILPICNVPDPGENFMMSSQRILSRNVEDQVRVRCLAAQCGALPRHRSHLTLVVSGYIEGPVNRLKSCRKM